jgi:hypothetical protein
VYCLLCTNVCAIVSRRLIHRAQLTSCPILNLVSPCQYKEARKLRVRQYDTVPSHRDTFNGRCQGKTQHQPLARLLEPEVEPLQRLNIRRLLCILLPGDIGIDSDTKAVGSARVQCLFVRDIVTREKAVGIITLRDIKSRIKF